MVFNIVCSYCGKDMGTKEAPGNNVSGALEEAGIENVSHSICPDCFREQMIIINARDNGGDEDV